MTDALSELDEGTELDIIGPLGNIYPEIKGSMWMIGGGTGNCISPVSEQHKKIRRK